MSTSNTDELGSRGVRNLSPAPTDGVTRVAFSKNGKRLLYSTWNGTLAIHCPSTGLLEAEGTVPSKCALLDASWAGDGSDTVAVAALDGRVLESDASMTKWNVVGCHADSAARGVVHNANHRVLISGGWDGFLRFWDPRARDSSTLSEKDIGGKCFGLAQCGAESVIAITSARHVVIVDVRKTSEFVHDKVPNALSYQLRGISANADGTRYVVGSTEGKVALEWPLDPKRAYSFRCHRVDGLSFPINCIAHNARFGSFATGGGDGHVAIWDAERKKRVVQYSRESTSIASLDFSADSNSIAVAVSYTFEEGEKDHPPDSICIRYGLANDIKVST